MANWVKVTDMGNRHMDTYINLDNVQCIRDDAAGKATIYFNEGRLCLMDVEESAEQVLKSAGIIKVHLHE